MTEIGMIGREGLAGLPFILSAHAEEDESMVHCSGRALRISAVVLRAEMGQGAPLRDLLLRYALAFQMQVSQIAACTGRHTLEQRLARWLLMAIDRLDEVTIPITHDVVSMMLGVRRSGVTIAAGTMRDRGLIQHSRGLVTVLDRQGLEAAACECHRVVRREYDELVGHEILVNRREQQR